MHWSDLEVAASARVVHSGLQGRTRPVGEAQAFVAVRHPAAAPAQRSSSAQAQLPPGHAVGTGTGLPRPCRTPMKRRHSAHCRGPRGGGCRQRNAEHVCTRNHRQGLEAALCSHITGRGSSSLEFVRCQPLGVARQLSRTGGKVSFSLTREVKLQRACGARAAA